MRLFQDLFSPKALLNFYQKRNVLREDSSRFSALCDLPEPSKNFLKNFFLHFFKGFPLRKMFFFAVFSWGRMVFETYAYPFGYFSGAVNLMKF